MALVWQKQSGDNEYRVVRAGASIRLYRNGVLHSQWNPLQPIKGNLWELFLLTVIGKKQPLQRVLLLGVGGGAVVNLIQAYFPAAVIDAIELDKIHINVAKKYFLVNTKQCNLIHADAIDWIKNNAGCSYDLIIDDVFHENEFVPCRSIQISADWIKTLLDRLSSGGTLVINFADSNEWNSCANAPRIRKILRKYQIGSASNKRCENRVIHISTRPLSAGAIKKSLLQFNHKAYLRYWSKGIFSYRSVAR